MNSWKKEHRRSVLDFLIEALLVGIGVFLALMANNWHEEREHRALAASTLRNFAEEIRTNQRNVEQFLAYHETLGAELQKFVRAPGPHTGEQFAQTVHYAGVRPVHFEHTAWDLALATQALSYLPSDLALAISKVYTQQNSFQTLENNFVTAAYTLVGADGPAAGSKPTSAQVFPGIERLAPAMAFFLGDVNVQEPQLLALYKKVAPQVEGALAGK